MSKCNRHIYVCPDQLSIWRDDELNNYVGEYIGLKATIISLPFYYKSMEGINAEDFNIELDNKCVYMTCKKELSDTHRMIGLNIEWDNGCLTFPIPHVSFTNPNDDNHKVEWYTVSNNFVEPTVDFLKADGTIDVDAVEDKIWNAYVKFRETHNNTGWCHDDKIIWDYNIDRKYFEDTMDKWFPECRKLIREFIEEKCALC